MAPQTIDLGELPGQEAPPAEPPWPGWQQLHHRLGSRPWRVAVAAVVALMTAVTVTAAAPSPWPTGTPHFTVRAHLVHWDEEHLYTVNHTRAEGVLTAYRLTDGSAAWQLPIAAETGEVWLTSTDGMLLVNTSVAQADGQRAGLTRLDPRSGAPIWSVDGFLSDVAGDHLLLRQLISHNHEQSMADFGVDLTIIHATTGLPAWQVRLAGFSAVVDQAGTGRVVTLDFHGRLSSYDLRGGQLLAQTTTTPGAPDEPVASELSLHPASSTLLLQRQTSRESTLAAYDTITLERLWTVTEFSPTSWTRPCEPVICVTNGADHLHGLDPRSGEQVWVADWLPPVPTAHPHSGVEVRTHPGLPGVVEVIASGELPRSWLVDAGSGAPVLALGGGWLLLSDEAAGPDDPPLAVRVTGRSAGPQPLWLGRVRPDLNGIEFVGSVDPRHGWCQPGRRGHVICQTEPRQPADPHTVTVWLDWSSRLGTL